MCGGHSHYPRYSERVRYENPPQPATPSPRVSTVSCPGCGTAIQEDFVFCPNCGRQVLTACRNCHRAVETDWTHCAFCGTELIAAPIEK